jgi:hypothetical protein
MMVIREEVVSLAVQVVMMVDVDWVNRHHTEVVVNLVVMTMVVWD